MCALKLPCRLIASSTVTVLDAERQRARLMQPTPWSSLAPFGGLSERNMFLASTFPQHAALPRRSASGAALRYRTLLAAAARSSSPRALWMTTPSASLIATCIGVLALRGMSMATVFLKKSDCFVRRLPLLARSLAIGSFWHLPAVRSDAIDGRLRLKSGLWQAVQRRVYEFAP
jgi:hypothetical protein